MENENEEIINSTNDTETTENPVEEVFDDNVEEKDTEGDLEALKKEIETLKFQKDHWKKKAQSTEDKKEVDSKPVIQKKSNYDLSLKDILALTKNGVNEEDVDEVIEFAKYKKISVMEALQNNIVKSTLQEKEENRRIAQATASGNTRRGTSKVSDEQLLANARKGILPDNDDDIFRLANIRRK